MKCVSVWLDVVQWLLHCQGGKLYLSLEQIHSRVSVVAAVSWIADKSLACCLSFFVETCVYMRLVGLESCKLPRMLMKIQEALPLLPFLLPQKEPRNYSGHCLAIVLSLLEACFLVEGMQNWDRVLVVSVQGTCQVASAVAAAALDPDIHGSMAVEAH